MFKEKITGEDLVPNQLPVVDRWLAHQAWLALHMVAWMEELEYTVKKKRNENISRTFLPPSIARPRLPIGVHRAPGKKLVKTENEYDM